MKNDVRCEFATKIKICFPTEEGAILKIADFFFKKEIE